MFRGGPVDSRGTGITSGLSYGGRVGLQGGGMPPTGGSIMSRGGLGGPRFRPPMVINQPSTGTTSGGLRFGSRGPKNPFRISGYTPKQFAPSSLREELRLLSRGIPLSLGGLKGIGLMSLPFAPTAAMAAMNMPKTDEALKFIKETDTSVFDETAIPGMIDETGTYIPGEYEQFAEELSKKNREGKPITATDVLAGYDPVTDTYPSIFGRYEDIQKRADIEKNKSTDNPLEDTGDKSKLSPKDLRILELEAQVNKFLETPKPAKETDMEESVEIDKEKFAKILGKDKARGQDIADMLLSFSSKALAPEATVKSAFSEFAADEVKRPSRVRAIEDNAAALAINKYIKGEISRAEADQYIKRIELTQKLRDESDKKTLAEYIQAADEGGFVKKVKVGANSYYAQQDIIPTYEVVKSKDMKPVEEGGKFKFSQDDVGVIFIEEDTRKVYTFDSAGNKKAIINM
jgi:hypothetical protein